MSFFDENNLEKVLWRCLLNLEKYFKKPLVVFTMKIMSMVSPPPMAALIRANYYPEAIRSRACEAA